MAVAVVEVRVITLVNVAVKVVLVVTVFVADAVVVVVDKDVTVEVQSSPHMTGQLVFANWPCSPSSVQSDNGIRDPQPAASWAPWHDCGA